MHESGLGDNTVRKHIAVAKVFFNAAVRKRLIETNPFEDLKSHDPAEQKPVLLRR